MAAGELTERVPVRGDDELAQLSEDFNTMAAQLEIQVQELKDAAQRQEDFIGSFAHEIKTPLTSIIGYADLLRSRPATAEQVREAAGYIFNEGRRLESLSRKLMDLIVLDKQDFSLHPVPMDAFLQRVGGALRPALEQQGICLTVQAESAKIPLEPDLMETVFLNLLDNARKSMDHGGRIALEGLIEGDGYCIRVSDEGKGIPASELERITEAFYMVDKSRARAQGGAGLGLAICQRIVALHGGVMEFQSTEGVGTCVRVHLKGVIAL
jgi:signal transduction histidine kinase